MRKLIAVIVIFAFVCSLFVYPSSIQAQVETHSYASLPIPGTMVGLSPAFQPVMIRGLTVHKDNPFLFDFILDVGNGLKPFPTDIKNEATKLIKYFLASLTIPEKDLWVNLSPYEKDRVIPDALGQTDMGRDLLAQDYMLKQITASLIYPEKGLGKEFWNRVYAKAQELYGHSVDVPVNTFNKVWIMADKASVFEHDQTVFVVDCHLKVMLEEDYLAQNRGQRPIFSKNDINFKNRALSPILRDLILPELEREINQGKNFANLRQIFNSIILSSWYKNNLKEALLTQVYADKEKVKGIDLADKDMKQKIYEQYLKAYKKGVFNYIKDTETPHGQLVPRKYFSGGVVSGVAVHAEKATASEAMLAFTNWGTTKWATLTWQVGLRGKGIFPRKKAPVISNTDPLGVLYNKIFAKRRMSEGNLEGFIGLVTSEEVLLGPENVLRRALTLLFSLQIALKNRIQAEEEQADENVVELTISRDNINLIKQYLPQVQKAMNKVKLFSDHKHSISDRIDQFLARTNNEFYQEILKDPLRRRLIEKYLMLSKGQGRDYAKEKEITLNALPMGGVYSQEYYKRMFQSINDAAMTDVRGTGNSIISEMPEQKKNNGGIDLQASKAQWTNQKEGDGVQMKVDAAMVEQWRREGIYGLDFKVLSITPMVRIWPVLGMEAPRRGG